MPQYLLIAFDKIDSTLIERRNAVRQAHLDMMKPLMENGNVVLGAAILHEDGDRIIGSVGVYDFESEADMRKYLDDQPYAKHIWERYEIYPLWIASVKGERAPLPSHIRPYTEA